MEGGLVQDLHSVTPLAQMIFFSAVVFGRRAYI